MSNAAFLIPESLHYLIVTYINSSMVEVVEEDVPGLELSVGRKDLPAGGPEAVSHVARVGSAVRIGSGGPVAVQHQGAAVIVGYSQLNRQGPDYDCSTRELQS